MRNVWWKPTRETLWSARWIKHQHISFEWKSEWRSHSCDKEFVNNWSARASADTVMTKFCIMIYIDSLQNKPGTASPSRQNLSQSGKLSFFTIYMYIFLQNFASLRLVSDLILKTVWNWHLKGLSSMPEVVLHSIKITKNTPQQKLPMTEYIVCKTLAILSGPQSQCINKSGLKAEIPSAA